ncbi:MAG: Arc family DNA-binding protein [Gemmatimonadetes bacterium]|nr:Arc family DNA-binding protein [Gemmatimonadota bacterium]
MPVNLSIKNVPDDLADLLRGRAAVNHRSLQGELMAILEDAVRAGRGLTPAEVLMEVRKLGLRTPAESVTLVRQARDAR